MARDAVDMNGSMPRYSRLVNLPPARVEFAVRLAVVAVAASLIAEIYQTPDIALTAYLAFFVVKKDRMSSIATSIVMMLLMTFVVALVLILAKHLLDNPAARVLTMAAISFSVMFAASASKLAPFGSTIALIIAYALDLLGGVPGGEYATRALLYVLLFVGIPAAASICVNLLVGPSPWMLAMGEMAARLHAAASLLSCRTHASREDFQAVLFQGEKELQTWLKMARAEKTKPAGELAILTQCVASTSAILLLVEALDRTADTTAAQDIACLVDGLEQMASILRKGCYPVESDLHHLVVTTTAAQKAILEELLRVIAGFAVVEHDVASTLKPVESKSGFFAADAFTNPAHVRFALKVTAAAMFCYVTYALLNYPGIHTCLITCYIVSLNTSADTMEKLGLRLGGAVLGAIVGTAVMVFIMPSLDSIQALLGVVLIGSFGAALIAGGSQRISYAGFQLAFAFFLCVLQGPSPAFDLTVARDRVIGILFGNVVVYLVSTNLWPVSIVSRIDPPLEKLIDNITRFGNGATHAVRLGIAATSAQLIEALATNLSIAEYEPSSMRVNAGWLASRGAAAEAAIVLHGALLAANESLMPAQFWERVTRLRSLLTDSTASAPSRSLAIPTAAPQARGESLADLVDIHLQQLEAALEP